MSTSAGRVRLKPFDLAKLLVESRAREAAGNANRLRVIGDGHVLIAARAARLDHLRQVVFPVRVGRVDLQIAADVGQLDERRETARLRRLDLAARFPDLRRDPRQADGFEHLALLAPADAAGAAEDAVLVDLEAVFEAESAHGNVVRLRAGEVMEGGPE
jgi:hypothetical protein